MQAEPPELATLVVRFTRTSPTQHRLDIMPPSGRRESRTLETRSCLVHDLVHFAVETEARLTGSFYAILARGTPYATLTDATAGVGYGAELWMTERVVGALQGALKTEFEPAKFVAFFAAAQESMGEASPAWLTVDLVARVQSRLRQLLGAWRATKFGEAMELRFTLAGASA